MIELRSDTFTRPTDAMRRAMYEAEVGDDVYGEDPTVNLLEETIAEMTGAEAALFVSSGTLGNLLPLIILGGRGKEILLHENAHILHHEVGGISAVAGAVPIAVPGDRGIMRPGEISSRIKKNDYDIAHTSLIAIENTHNFEGGTCWSREDLQTLAETAAAENLPVHMDGARCFNASVATGLSLKEIFGFCHSANFCLSKGLGAPVGSLLCGPADLISEARRWRKILGGGMRQAGVIASAGLFALKNNISRLAEDHEHARMLAETLSETSWAHTDPGRVETNIVFFRTREITAESVVEKLKDQGVMMIATGPDEVRLVTSLEINRKQTEDACRIIRTLTV